MRVVMFFVVLIGALLLGAHFAGPEWHYCTNKTRTAYATMEADLRNLERAQTQFKTDSGRFAQSLSELLSAYYATSTGITVTIEGVTDSSWTAVARHGIIPETTCTITAYANESTVTDESARTPVCTPPQRQSLKDMWC